MLPGQIEHRKREGRPYSSPSTSSYTHVSQVLNQEDGNDLLTETNMTNFQFTIALMVFLIAYALFEVPSNYMLKRLKPSNWIAFLMLSWGAITMGLGGVQNFASVTAVRFLLGVFEAGLFPGLVCEYCFRTKGCRILSDKYRLPHLLVSHGGALDKGGAHSCFSNARRRFWW